MTTQDKFIALTRKGEDTRIEYKTCTEEVSESLYESVCSFLNHSGSQFLFSITYQDENVPDSGQMSATNVPNKGI